MTESSVLFLPSRAPASLVHRRKTGTCARPALRHASVSTLLSFSCFPSLPFLLWSLNDNEIFLLKWAEEFATKWPVEAKALQFRIISVSTREAGLFSWIGKFNCKQWGSQSLSDRVVEQRFYSETVTLSSTPRLSPVPKLLTQKVLSLTSPESLWLPSWSPFWKV